VRTTSLGAAFESPEEFEALAVPVEKGSGFENQPQVFPILQAASQQEQRETIGGREAWFLGVALEDEELLAEQGIFESEIRLGAG
jgi:hypothetical protein